MPKAPFDFAMEGIAHVSSRVISRERSQRSPRQIERHDSLHAPRLSIVSECADTRRLSPSHASDPSEDRPRVECHSEQTLCHQSVLDIRLFATRWPSDTHVDVSRRIGVGHSLATKREGLAAGLLRRCGRASQPTMVTFPPKTPAATSRGR